MRQSIVVFMALCVASSLLAQTTEEPKAPPPAAPPAAPPAPPAPPPPVEPVFPETVPKITAGYQEKGAQLVRARNYVDFTYQSYRLQCDMLTYNVQTQEIDAEGNVILQDGKQRLAGEKLHFNIRLKRGVMFDASGTASPDLHFVADEAEKYDDRKYKATHGAFTSCTQPNPRWQISASKADLELDDHVTLKGATFKVKSVPVFFLPYMRYPIRDDDRATGFLLPNYGHSAVKGTIFGEAFFWAINRSQDATIAYRSFSDLGRGLEGEYRYIFSSSSIGTANLFYMFEKAGTTDKPEGGNTQRKAENVKGYFFNLQHRQLLPFGITNQTDVTILTSYAFKTIYGSNFQNLSDPRKFSSAYFSKPIFYDTINFQLRRDELLRGSVRHEETYYVKKKPRKRIWFTEDSDITNRFPDISVTHNQQKLGASPLLLSGSASFLGYETYHQATNTSEQTTIKTPVTNFTRLNWDPAISVPITAIPWMTFNPTAIFSGAYWTDSYALGTTKPGGGSLLRNTFVSRVQIYGPNFNRIFSTPNWNFSRKWKHSIEPFFQFDYNTKFENATRVLSGAGDHIGAGGTQLLTYSLTNTLWGKRTLIAGYEPTPVDIVRWTLLQRYQPNATYVDPDTKKHVRFGDLNSQLSFKLAPYVDFSFTTNYDFNWMRFVDYQYRGTVAKTDSFNAGIGWTIQKNRKTGENVNNALSASGGFNIKRIGFHLDGYLAYSPMFKENKIQNATLRWSQTFQCWGFELMYQRYKFYSAQENSITFAIHIGSIGTISERIGGSRF
ncbi:MAG: LPS-assembly protein LptD [Acidobacteria bacterium]|nr:LPS-assembly protein LptD [Acidobacteriota bacterium]